MPCTWSTCGCAWILGPLQWTDRLGRQRSRSRREEDGLAIRSVVWNRALPPCGIAILYSDEHRCLLKLPRQYWKDEALTILEDALGGKSASAPKPLTSREVEVEFPGTLAVWQRHGRLTLALATIFLLLLEAALLNASR